MNKLDIAESIFENDVLMEAAIIADGLRRAKEYFNSHGQIQRAVKLSGESMKDLFRKMMGEDE